MNKGIILAEDFSFMASENIRLYCTHALCHKGEASFCLAGHLFKMQKGDCIIFPHSELVSEMRASEDFRTTVLYLSNEFAMQNKPKNDYDVVGRLSLLRNPVLPLLPEEQKIFMEDVEHIRQRESNAGHRFYNDLMGCLIEIFQLDLYDFHARIYGEPHVSGHGAILLGKFIEMLKSGEYETHREVSYYASRLFITPKYLSEISKNISGYSANFWIGRFTIDGIIHLLSNKNISLKNIAERFHFSSMPHFCRYVQNILGVSPTKYRNSFYSK